MVAMRTEAPRQPGCTGRSGVCPARALGVLALVASLALGCARPEGQDRPGSLEGGDPTPFSVTAYCTGTVTKSGARVRAGMAAADPRILPLGSTVLVEGQGPDYDGIYTVMDTGSAVKGRILDLYLGDCAGAKEFGRREMTVTVIRHGWDPSATPVGTGGQSTGESDRDGTDDGGAADDPDPDNDRGSRGGERGARRP